MAQHPKRVYCLLVLVVHILIILAIPTGTRNDINQPEVITAQVRELNDTVVGDVIFAPEPRGRGSWGIIFSCTTTFIFCVWTAVHPNVIPNVRKTYRILYRAVLTAISIIVPEGMIMCAFSQWYTATHINSKWKARTEHKTYEERRYLGMDGAFFVVMGGFVFDISGDHDAPPAGSETKQAPCSRPSATAADKIEEEADMAVDKPTTRRVETNLDDEDPGDPKAGYTCTTTLTPAGFLKYMNEGRIDRFSFQKKDIEDKSKADNVAKLLSGSQAAWLLIQCAARWQAKMKLTLLEIHVLIQVVCAAIMFASWWHKPLNINEPIKITIWEEKYEAHVTPEKRKASRFSKAEFPILNPHRYRNPGLEPDNYATDRVPVNCIAVLEKALYDIISCIAPLGPYGEYRKNERAAVGPMIAEGTLVCLNGLLHAVAWNTHFPNNVEQSMWRWASLGMCVFPLIVVFIAGVSGYHRELIMAVWDFKQKKLTLWSKIIKGNRRIHKVALRYSTLGGTVVAWRYALTIFTISICFGSLLVYLVCILFITVESYISIRNPPDGAFLTPRWNDYWPHL